MRVGVARGTPPGVGVGVATGGGVAIGVGVAVGVGVAAGVGVAVGVGVALGGGVTGTGVAMGVGVVTGAGLVQFGADLCGVTLGIGVGLGVGVGLGMMGKRELYRFSRPPLVHFPARDASLSVPCSNLLIVIVSPRLGSAGYWDISKASVPLT